LREEIIYPLSSRKQFLFLQEEKNIDQILEKDYEYEEWLFQYDLSNHKLYSFAKEIIEENITNNKGEFIRIERYIVVRCKKLKWVSNEKSYHLLFKGEWGGFFLHYPSGKYDDYCRDIFHITKEEAKLVLRGEEIEVNI
jgi:hypothetical protein